MNVKILSSSQMVTLTRAWVNHQRMLFLSIPQIAGLFPDVQQAHDQLLSTHLIDGGDSELARITRELEETDARHDETLRALWSVFNGSLSWLRSLEPRHTEEADWLQALRDRLLPEGLAYLKHSYLTEADNAEMAMEQLTPEVREQLRGLPLQNGTALDIVEQWGALGARLGELERQRSRLYVITDGQVSDYQARVAWAGVVEAVLSLLERVKGHGAAVTLLRQPILDAVSAEQARIDARGGMTTGSHCAFSRAS